MALMARCCQSEKGQVIASGNYSNHTVQRGSQVAVDDADGFVADAVQGR